MEMGHSFCRHLVMCDGRKWRMASCWLALGVFLALLAGRQAFGGSQDGLARLIVGHLKQTREIVLDIGCGDAGLARALAGTSTAIHWSSPARSSPPTL
jgi:hypothetical protein